MIDLLIALSTQALIFFPLALAVSVSYHILRATDMTIDGSFVLGAVIFARLVSLNVSPYLAFPAALMGGASAGMMTAQIARGGRIDPLLAGVLATFILSSINLGILGRPNISLLSAETLVSSAFAQSELFGWLRVGFYVSLLCALTFLVLQSRFGLILRAFGENPLLLKRLGHHIERYRSYGFALTNLLAAGSGCLTAQTIGYADIGMGFGMTLTGIGAIILGQQILKRIVTVHYFRITCELIACLIGVTIYFFALNLALRFDISPQYLKLIIGLMLIFFLRTAVTIKTAGNNL